MSEEECRQYFDWFMKEVPKRLKILDQVYLETEGGDQLDFTPHSLHPLWEWYKDQVWKTQRVKDVNKDLKWYPDWVKESVENGDFTTETIPLINDVAIYFAETLMRNHCNLKWDLVTDPDFSDDFSRNRPIVNGFGVGTSFYPMHVMSILTRQMINGKRDTLYDLYEAWVEDV